MDIKRTIKKEIPEVPQVIIREVSKSKSLLLSLLSLLVVTTFLTLYFGYKLTSAVKTAEDTTQKQIADLVAKVGQLIVLPSDETPTLATVTDLDKLKDQPFFAHAQVGDKVLIYVKAGKAILYNPVSNKIVDVSPLAPGSTGVDQAQAPKATPKIKK